MILALVLTAVAWRLSTPVAALFLLAAFLGMTATVTENLSRPKPIQWERRFGVNEVEVLWFRIAEGKAVYAVVLIPDEPEPRFYEMKWDRKLADTLSQLRDKMERGHRVMIPYPFEKSLEYRKPLVPHALPPPALPRKAGDDKPPTPQVEL